MTTALLDELKTLGRPSVRKVLKKRKSVKG